MREIKKISNDTTRYPMAMHIDMQEQIYGLIQPFAPEKILLGTTDIPSWKKDIDQEKDAVRDTPPSESIPFLTAKGKKRREIVSSLFLEIRAASTSPVETRAKAAHRLRLVIDSYKGLQRENLIEETGHVSGLLNDLDKPTATADLATLGLTEVVQMLHTVHNEYLTLRGSRVKDLASDTLPSGASLRVKNDATADQIFRHIEAAYLSTTTDDDRKAIGELIDRINAVLGMIKTTYRQRIAQKKASSKKKKGGKDKEPKQPEPPKNPKKRKDEPDIRLPEDEKPKTPDTPGGEPPKKPEGGGETPEPPKKPESGGSPEIHLPEE